MQYEWLHSHALIHVQAINPTNHLSFKTVISHTAACATNKYPSHQCKVYAAAHKTTTV